MKALNEHEVFITFLSPGRPAFWKVYDGRPVMLQYATTAAGRDEWELAHGGNAA